MGMAFYEEISSGVRKVGGNVVVAGYIPKVERWKICKTRSLKIES
jgi:hypothetical protein